MFNYLFWQHLTCKRAKRETTAVVARGFVYLFIYLAEFSTCKSFGDVLLSSSQERKEMKKINVVRDR